MKGLLIVCVAALIASSWGYYVPRFLSLTSSFARHADLYTRYTVGYGGSDPTCTGSARRGAVDEWRRSRGERFEGAEHRCVGNNDLITILDTSNTTAVTYRDVDITTVTLTGASGVVLGTYGDVVAMAGDFFAPNTQQEIICLGTTPADRSARYYAALATIDSAPQNGVNQIRAEFDDELAAIKKNTTKITWQVYRQFSFARFLFNLAAGSANGTAFADAVYKRLVVNYDHFGQCGQLAWSTGHQEAMLTAQAAGSTLRAVFANGASTTTDKQNALATAQTALLRAYMMNAFSDHFMTDQFSAGHIRTPRDELVQKCGTTPGGLQANYQHDEENRNGLYVVNRNNDTWQSFGDSNVFDIRNLPNLNMVHSAVRASRVELIQAFQGAPLPGIGNETSLRLVPALNPNEPLNAQQCPLFRVNPTTGVLEQRSNIIRLATWNSLATEEPPFDSSVSSCPPVNLTALKEGCSYKTMDASDCPGNVELAFAKQPFVDPSKFGARILCYDSTQRAYVMQYGVNSLSAGQIAGIVIGCVAFAVLVGIGIFFLVQKCCLKATEGSDMAKVQATQEAVPAGGGGGGVEMTSM